MLKSLVFGLTQLIGKPQYLLPALAGIFVNFLILFFAVDSYFNFFYNALVFGEIPNASLFELPFYLLTTYAFDILVIVLTVFFSTSVGFYMIYVYSALMTTKQSMMKVMIGTLSRIGEIFGLTLFLMVALLLYGAILYGLIIFGFAFEGLAILSTILILALLLLGIFAFVKLAFTPVIMVIEKQKLKPALKKSWEWSAKKTLNILVFLFLLSVITGLTNTFFALLGEATDIEILGIVILLLGLALSSSYYNIAFIKYFLNSQTK
ncbi:MAG TPA: hypothetical protein VFF13_05230 [archaeon]|nr:hypothetical protein [archaeon]